jgi:hypothetical protein
MRRVPFRMGIGSGNQGFTSLTLGPLLACIALQGVLILS